jgi:hypothetical protein
VVEVLTAGVLNCIDQDIKPESNDIFEFHVFPHGSNGTGDPSVVLVQVMPPESGFFRRGHSVCLFREKINIISDENNF